MHIPVYNYTNINIKNKNYYEIQFDEIYKWNSYQTGNFNIITLFVFYYQNQCVCRIVSQYIYIILLIYFSSEWEPLFFRIRIFL